MVAPAAIASRQTSRDERRVGAGRVLARELDLVDVARGVARRAAARARPPPAARARACSPCGWGSSRGRRGSASGVRSGEGLGGRVDVVRVACARARRRSRRPTVPRDGAHALEVAGRGDREAGLDHVDAEPLELRGDLRLLVRLQGDARRLLAVAKRRVEDRDPAGWQLSSSSSRPVRGRTGGVVRSACALRGAWSKAPPRGGESRRRGGKSGRAQPPRVGLRNGCCARRSSLQVCKCCRAGSRSVKSISNSVDGP